MARLKRSRARAAWVAGKGKLKRRASFTPQARKRAVFSGRKVALSPMPERAASAGRVTFKRKSL